jgi:adenylylsulfate kinase-like enzyme
VTDMVTLLTPPRCARLEHVYWIGGGSGAGKSIIARRLAGRRGPTGHQRT